MFSAKHAVPKNYLPPYWLLLVLFVAYALPGNLLHAPWRGDDLIAIDIATGILRHGDWLAPPLAGSHSVDWWPPLPHWLGAVLGLSLGWLIPEHDAIRLASVVSLTILLLCLRGISRRLYGPDSARAAVLITLGSLGLLVHAHEAQPLMLLCASVAATLYGLVLARENPRHGALIAGVSAAAAFLSGGLAGAFLTLPLWFAMPVICAECRDRQTRREWLLALAVALLLAAIWPLLLAIHEPTLFAQWWAYEWREILPHASHLNRLGQLGSLLAWFAWPLWLIAGWSLWRQRRQLREFRLLLPTLAAGLALWLVSTTGSMRNANMLPLLPPLIVLAAGELPKLRRGAINFLDWFGVMTFSAIIAFVWLAFVALHLGWPSGLARNIHLLAQGYDMPFSLWATLLAAVLTLGWIASITRMPFFQLRGAVHWALGVTLTWGVASVLWQPWIDYTKNYAPMVERIARDTRGAQCLATLGAGAAQHAALNYFAGILPHGIDAQPRQARQCPFLLTYASGRNHVVPTVGAEWKEVWQARRGRGRTAETFVLYRRAG